MKKHSSKSLTVTGVYYNDMGKRGAFDTLNGISENFTSVQLMDSIGNVNRDMSLVGYWIFYYNYKQAPCLTRELLYLICSTSVREEQVVNLK